MRKTLLTAALIVSPGLAAAHTGHPEGAGFVAGALHPLAGADHLMAMVAVGLWAAVVGGKALWVWPLAFVAALGVGGVAGMAGFSLPAVEPAILASIVVLGSLAALAFRPGLWAGASLVAGFALFHGHAHGTEGPQAGLIAYAAGFMTASLALHLAGLGFGLGARALARPAVTRIAGGLAALAGLGLSLA